MSPDTGFKIANEPTSSSPAQAAPERLPEEKVVNPAEYDLLMLEINERSIRFLDAKPAVRSFFMCIDSIYYERDRSPHLCKDHSVGGQSELVGSSSEHFRSRDKNWISKSFRLETIRPAESHVGGSLKQTSRIAHDDHQLNSNDVTRQRASHMPKHNMVVTNLKAKWNNVNRNVVYMLYEIYYRSKRLRHNLSSQALKEYDLLTDQIVHSQLIRPTTDSAIHNRKQWAKAGNSPKPTSQPATTSINENGSIAENPFEELLNKLDAERASNLNVYCDEPSGANHSTSANFNDLLYGPNSIRMSDVVDEHVFIEFINSQIKLSLDESTEIEANVNEVAGQPPSSNKANKSQKQQQRNNQSTINPSPITRDYLIISAARASVIQHMHKPVWKNQRYLEKTSLSGYLESMQYFATLNSPQSSSSRSDNNEKLLKQDQEFWLSDELIDPKVFLPTVRPQNIYTT